MSLDKIRIAIDKQGVHVNLNDDLQAYLYPPRHCYLKLVFIFEGLKIVDDAKEHRFQAVGTEDQPLAQRVTSQAFQVLLVTASTHNQSHPIHLKNE